MKKPGLSLAPARPAPMSRVAPFLLLLGYVLWVPFCLFFDPYPERSGELGQALAQGSLVFLLASIMCFALSFALALVAVILGYSRCRNGWLLASVPFWPVFCLVMLMLLNPYS